jgi:hypothetical protein
MPGCVCVALPVQIFPERALPEFARPCRARPRQARPARLPYLAPPYPSLSRSNRSSSCLNQPILSCLTHPRRNCSYLLSPVRTYPALPRPTGPIPVSPTTRCSRPTPAETTSPANPHPARTDRVLPLHVEPILACLASPDPALSERLTPSRATSSRAPAKIITANSILLVSARP